METSYFFTNIYLKLVRNIYSSNLTPERTDSRKNKTFEGQLFTFRDRQDSCLLSAARLDIADDRGKGKVVTRKILFVQENSFLSQYTLAGYIFLLCRGLSTTRPEIGK